MAAPLKNGKVTTTYRAMENEPIIWDDARVGEKEGCVIFMGISGKHEVAGAIPTECLEDYFRTSNVEPVTLFRRIAPSLRKSVENLYGLGRFKEVWDAPGVLRHRRVEVMMPKMG